jgi:hypothetical protein
VPSVVLEESDTCCEKVEVDLPVLDFIENVQPILLCEEVEVDLPVLDFTENVHPISLFEEMEVHLPVLDFIENERPISDKVLFMEIDRNRPVPVPGSRLDFILDF